jgi:hypothetical protein
MEDMDSSMNHPTSDGLQRQAVLRADAETDECPQCGAKTEFQAVAWDEHGNAMEEAIVCPGCGPIEPMFHEEPVESRFPQGDPNSKAEVPMWLKSLAMPMTVLTMPKGKK